MEEDDIIGKDLSPAKDYDIMDLRINARGRNSVSKLHAAGFSDHNRVFSSGLLSNDYGMFGSVVEN